MTFIYVCTYRLHQLIVWIWPCSHDQQTQEISVAKCCARTKLVPVVHKICMQHVAVWRIAKNLYI